MEKEKDEMEGKKMFILLIVSQMWLMVLPSLVEYQGRSCLNIKLEASIPSC